MKKNVSLRTCVAVILEAIYYVLTPIQATLNLFKAPKYKRRTIESRKDASVNLAIQLNEDQQRRLDEIASRLNVPPAILVEAAVRDLVDQSEADFERVSKRLLEKNRELYKRLR